jgi:glucokinase
MELYIGIEIGGTKLQLVTGNAEGKILERRRSTVDRTRAASGIQQQIEADLRELTRDNQPAAIGVGFGGPVDWKTGKVCQSHHIEGWSNFGMRDWLEQLTHGPVFVDNDANVAALGEARFGAGVGFNPVFYVTLGSGVGGGLTVDGEIYHGALPGESEIGHVRLDRSGTTVESQCSGWAVDAKIRSLVKAEPRSLLAKLSKGTVLGEARFLEPALKQGDANAAKLVRETAEQLAFGLSHVVHLFHPQIIVLGGGLSNLGEPLRNGVESALRGFIMGAFLPGPKIAISKLGEDAVPVGTLRLARGRPLAPSDSIT